jgi:hypothetical protein
MELEHLHDLVGMDLESTPDDGRVGPAVDEEEAVLVEVGEVGRPDPVRVGYELSRSDLEQSLLARGAGLSRFGVDDA